MSILIAKPSRIWLATLAPIPSISINWSIAELFSTISSFLLLTKIKRFSIDETLVATEVANSGPVSYTHLTLPTILLV